MVICVVSNGMSFRYKASENFRMFFNIFTDTKKCSFCIVLFQLLNHPWGDIRNGSVVKGYENGIGFSLLYKNKLATTAYSAFIIEDKLEIGIETIEEYRGKGFAQYTCAALIDYCITNNYEPVWSCRLENIGSYKLAIKLGFEPTRKLPFYRLSK